MMQKVKNFFHLLFAIFANIYFGFPSKNLKIIAITGTDGKTTTSTLLYHVLKNTGFKVALISTVAAYIGDERIDTGFHVTNPSSFALQRILKKIKEKSMDYVILEITSHGIDQYRNFGITPIASAITNVTHEHLDYHKTFDNYLRTKAKLLLSSKKAYLNKDAQQSFASLEAIVKKSSVAYKVCSYAKVPRTIRLAASERFGQEKYNWENVSLAYTIASDLGCATKEVAEAILSFEGVPGRMEHVTNKRGLRLIVDFAHTPQALKVALMSLQGKKTGKVIVVFGCAGLRDHTKRPLMGKIAAEYSDLAIFTAEDPRTENVWTILNQMKSDLKNEHGKILSIPNRFNAIKEAITRYAKKGDIVIVTGKGHELSMCFGKTEYHWNDREAIEQILVGNDWTWKAA